MAKFGFDESRLFNISDLSLEQVASAPSILSGQTAVYAKTDDLMYFTADGASEQQFTLGGENLGSPTANPDGADVFVQQDSSSAKLQFRRLVSTDGTVNLDSTTDPNLIDLSVDLGDINDELDHGLLQGLADDDHLQYLLLAGRSGGQVAHGGTDASENLTLRSTAHATKGAVQIIDGSKFIFNSRTDLEAELQTTDNTVQNISTVALADDTVYFVEAKIIGRRSAGGEGRVINVIRCAVYRAAGGAATLQGTVQQDFNKETAGGFDTDFAVSGNNLLVTVKGITGQTIDWKAQVSFLAQN